MGRYILGLHSGHNASVCIGDERGILYAVQEERLCREKNYWGFPRLAIEACLERASATPDDLSAVAHGGNQVLCRYHSRDDVIYAYQRQSTLVGKLRQRVAIPLISALKPNFGQGKLRQLLNEVGLERVPVVHYDHHLAHAATAYYGLRSSPAEEYLVVTCDGSGDNLCATVRVWGRGQCREIALTPDADSLGAIYSWITYGMGFVPFEHEYKLMGMGPYASDRAAEETAKIFTRYLGLDDTGLKFLRKTRRRTNDFYDLIERELRGKRFDYICAGLQRFTEDLLCQWIANAVRATGVRKVLAAGGVFMNVKANKRIAELPEVDSFEAFPSCGDETLSLGAYYLEAAKQYGEERVPPLSNFYLGDAPGDDEIEAAIREYGYAVERPADIADRVADLLSQGHPVVRCAGPMEFGARALGNRSILADPRAEDVVRVINRMVKKRDFWMPFAPMVKASRQHDYVVNSKQLHSPYMMMTFDTKSNFRELIAAVHNADLTCRAQILEPQQNPEMHAILDAFERRTGSGIILNTSFNLHGFPIVRTASEALDVLRDSGLEYLQLGNYLVSKNGAASREVASTAARAEPSMSSKLEGEARRIRAEYERREREMPSDFYALWHPRNLFVHQEHERLLLRSLCRAGMLPLADRRLLEVGCGQGNWLAVFEQLGAARANIAGIELGEERAEFAANRLPGADVRAGDATQLPWADRSFDVVFQRMMFTSILDAEARRQAAAEIMRVTRPGGTIVWNDFFLNPRNPRVCPLGKADIRQLFPGWRAVLWRSTLASPLARRLVPISWGLARALESLRLLNTFYIGYLQRGS